MQSTFMSPIALLLQENRTLLRRSESRADKVINSANTMIAGQQRAGAAIEISVGELKTQLDVTITEMRRAMGGF